MYYLAVSEVSFALYLDYVFWYVECYSCVYRSVLLALHNSDFGAETSCSASAGMRNQRLFCC